MVSKRGKLYTGLYISNGTLEALCNCTRYSMHAQIGRLVYMYSDHARSARVQKCFMYLGTGVAVTPMKVQPGRTPHHNDIFDQIMI